MLQRSACLVTQLCPTLCNLMDCSPIVSSVHGDSPGKNTGVGCHALLQRNSLNPGIELRSPTLQAGSSLSEPPGKPKVLQIIHLKWAISLPKFSFPKQSNQFTLPLAVNKHFICPMPSPTPGIWFYSYPQMHSCISLWFNLHFSAG